MTTELPRVHFTERSLINATNPITVNLIGAGGTGSKVLTALLEMNHSLIALGHPGLHVRLWDDDTVTEANLGRQRFASSEIGLYKSVALINRVNRFAGTAWKAETEKYERNITGKLPENAGSVLCLSCVDSVAARFEIGEILKLPTRFGHHDQPRYWMDFGNGHKTGQVVLATVGHLPQPQSMKYTPVPSLPFITDEFGSLLHRSETSGTASCSLAEALLKQDLYINAALAQMGCSLLWSLLREGMTPYRGFFLNLETFSATPLRC